MIITIIIIVRLGKQFLEQEYTHDRGSPNIPGWELNQSWFTEDGLPKKGHTYTHEYYALYIL